MTGIVTRRTTVALLAAAGAHLVPAVTGPNDGTTTADPVTYSDVIACSTALDGDAGGNSTEDRT